MLARAELSWNNVFLHGRKHTGPMLCLHGLLARGSWLGLFPNASDGLQLVLAIF